MKYNHLAIFSEANVHLNNINTKLNCHLISTLRILGIICPITSMGSNQNIIRIVLFIFIIWMTSDGVVCAYPIWGDNK